jgi:hypothetical protein
MIGKNEQLKSILTELKEVDYLISEAEESLISAGGKSLKFDQKIGMKKSPRWGLKSARAARQQIAGIVVKLKNF